jgi:hypothetical protein
MRDSDYREIPLYVRGGAVGSWALVDAEDYDEIAKTRWHVGSNGYARHGTSGRDFKLMHRLLLGLERGDKRNVDHRNGNKLDNRRENLRVVTHAQNLQNRFSSSTALSAFRGVSFKREERWLAALTVDGVEHRLGRFPTEIEAALAVDAWRRENADYYRPDPALIRVLSLIEDRRAA